MSSIAGGYDAIAGVMGEGRPTASAMAYFENQYSNMLQAAQNVGNSALSQIYQIAQQTYNYVLDTRPWELAEALQRQTAHMFDPHSIRPLTALAELQTAKPTMQRWIMANPEVREAYHDQRIDGYSGTYEDAQPKYIGALHYDWRLATSSMIDVNEETGGWKATTYTEELIGEERTPTFMEKVDIAISWASCVHFMQTQQYDPTSVWNNKM